MVNGRVAVWYWQLEVKMVNCYRWNVEVVCGDSSIAGSGSTMTGVGVVWSKAVQSIELDFRVSDGSGCRLVLCRGGDEVGSQFFCSECVRWMQGSSEYQWVSGTSVECQWARVVAEPPRVCVSKVCFR